MAKLAVLVGCNYPNTRYKLRGCHNDVLDTQEVLMTRFGFDKNDIEVIIDKPGSPIMPTAPNVKKALNATVDKAGEGDVLFFYCSGHGTLIKPRNSFHKEEEAIVPSDFNPITLIVNRVPEGATFTILSDSCHSGGLIDKETEQIGPAQESSNINAATNYQKHKGIPSQSLLDYYTSLTGKTSTNIRTHLLHLFGEDASLMFQPGVEPLAPLKKDEGILLSGCQPNEECIDTVVVDGNGRKRPCGAFSTAVQTVLKVKPGPITNRELVKLARHFLMEQNFIQLHPCLYCSNENADALFLCS